MPLTFYYFLLLKCFILKKMLKEKLHCLSHPFLTGHSSKSIKIKKIQAIDVPLETQWCLKLRNVGEMQFAENRALTFVYMDVLNLILCVCVCERQRFCATYIKMKTTLTVYICRKCRSCFCEPNNCVLKFSFRDLYFYM